MVQFSLSDVSGSAEIGGKIVPGRCGETCSARENEHQWLGWLGVVVAILFLGSNYVVVKQFDSGDGELYYNGNIVIDSLIYLLWDNLSLLSSY